MKLGALVALAVLAVAPLGAAAQDDAAASANNPLANIRALNLQNYHVPSIYGAPDATANTFFLRGAAPIGPILWRATLPVIQRPTGDTGLGDLNLLGFFLPVARPDLSVGIGPQITLPTGEEGYTTDGVQLGASLVAFKIASPAVLIARKSAIRKNFIQSG